LQVEAALAEVLAHGAFETLACFVLKLEVNSHALRGRVALEAIFCQQELLAQVFKPGGEGEVHALVKEAEFLSQLRDGDRGGEFGCAGRGRGAQIGSKIRDGEVGFMPDAGDDGHARSADGIGNGFIVECP